MKKIYMLVLLILLCMTGCENGHSVNEIDSYIIETEVGEIEIEPSTRLAPYTEILSQYTKKGSAYAFVRIAGCNEPVFLITDKYIEVKIGDIEACVTGEASAYVILNGRVHFLGSLQSEMPAYNLVINQLGYVYTAKMEDVKCWEVDEEHKKLVAVAGAYKERTGGTRYKYFNEETDGKIMEMTSESVLQSMHRKYARATAVRFIPFVPYD